MTDKTQTTNRKLTTERAIARLKELGYLDPNQGLHPIGTSKKENCTCLNCRNQ